MSHNVKKYYNPEKTIKQLLVFLHGYNACVEDIESRLKFLSEHLPNTIIIAPEAEEICEKNPQKKQWFSLRACDKDDKRRHPDTSLEEMLAIYNKYDIFLRQNAHQMNLWINQWQKEYDLDDTKTVIAGFSQGGMLACYTALTRANFTGKCLMLSSVVSGAENLAKEQKSCPDTFLFHGVEDINVHYQTMPFSENWLTQHKIKVKSYAYQGLAHVMREDELTDVVSVINQ